MTLVRHEQPIIAEAECPHPPGQVVDDGYDAKFCYDCHKRWVVGAAETGEWGIEVRHDIERDTWTVQMPHQCDEWEISWNEPREQAEAEVLSFIDELHRALGYLRAGREVLAPDPPPKRTIYRVPTPNDPHLFAPEGTAGTCKFCGGMTPGTHDPFRRFPTEAEGTRCKPSEDFHVEPHNGCILR